jgi:signal transduction histidine kinase
VTLRRVGIWLVLPAGLAFCVRAEYEQYRVDRPWTLLLMDILPGVVFIAAGVYVALRRPQNRCWVLLVLAGVTWAAGAFQASSDKDIQLFGFAFGKWYELFLVWLLLAFPTGRLQARRDRVLLVAMAALLTVRTLSRVFLHVPPDLSGCRCVENRFLPITDPRWFDRVESLYSWGSTIVVLLVVASLAERWWRASEPRRRMTTPALVAGVLLAAGMLYDNVLRSRLEIPEASQLRIYYALNVARIGVALSLVVGLLRLRSTRSAVVDLVAELGHDAAPARLGEAVGRALGDPDLVLLPWSAEAGAYVDESGQVVELDEVTNRAVTLIEQRGEPVAALVHDEALLEDPALVGAIVAAVRLTIDNEKLNAELEAQLEEVEASRARIVEAGDAERQRIERDLHDGAQQRLVTVALSLRLAASRDDVAGVPQVREVLLRAVNDLGDAVDELRDLARGIHPAILTDAGLEEALESLADRSPVPLDLEVVVAEEPPAPVAATLYFSVAEALTNVAKHAQATEVQVRVRQHDGRLCAEVHDNGVGGARSAAGSGLAGLADRVAALGGTMRVQSPQGRGTRLEVELPCASS